MSSVYTIYLHLFAGAVSLFLYSLPILYHNWLGKSRVYTQSFCFFYHSLHLSFGPTPSLYHTNLKCQGGSLGCLINYMAWGRGCAHEIGLPLSHGRLPAVSQLAPRCQLLGRGGSESCGGKVR